MIGIPGARRHGARRGAVREPRAHARESLVAAVDGRATSTSASVRSATPRTRPSCARCACGASLAGIDFSLKRAAAQRSRALTPTLARRAAGDPLAAERATAAATASSVRTPIARSPIRPDSERCVYCNRPLRERRRARRRRRRGRCPRRCATDYRVVEAFPVSGQRSRHPARRDAARRRAARRQALPPGARARFPAARRSSRRRSATASCACSRTASPTASPTSSSNTCPGGTLEELLRSGPLRDATTCAAIVARDRRRARTASTRTASCIAISSPRTCWCARARRSSSR